MDDLIKTLHKIQEIYYNYIDISIESRIDKKSICVHVCTYVLDENNNFINTSKLYAFIFKLNNDEENINELKKLLDTINLLYIKYCVTTYDVYNISNILEL